MNPNIDFNKVTDIDMMKGETNEETRELISMASEARTYLESFPWCKSIIKVYFGIGYPGIVAVFLFNIVPSKQNVDEWIWVIVGDIPPAYIVVDDAPNPASALDAYIGEMSLWVNAIKQHKPVDRLIPVDAAPILENANDLETRLSFIDEEILTNYKEDLNM